MKTKHHSPKNEKRKLVLTHSADRRNIVGIPAEQNPKFKKFNRRPTAR